VGHGAEPSAALRGVVLEVKGSCDLKKSDGAPDTPLKKDQALHPGDRIACKLGVRVRMRLPGSSEDTEFVADRLLATYGVPAAQRARQLLDDAEGARSGRSGLLNIQPSPQGPRLANLETMQQEARRPQRARRAWPGG
jgi:hypothetical protein